MKSGTDRSIRRLSLRGGESTRIWDSEADLPVLLLLHGLANSLEIWERVQPRFAERYRVIAFDWPGFGEATRPLGNYDGAFFAERIVALMDLLGISRAHLVGYSMGASAILHLSQHYLSRIDRAVLAAPGSFGRRVHPLMLMPALPLVGSWLGRPNPVNNRMTLRLAIHDPNDVSQDLVERTNRHAAIPGSARSFHSALTAGVGPFGARGLAHMAKLARGFARPALILWGENDRVFPPRNAARASKLLPDAQVVMIPRCGHYPQWEQPAAFAATVEEFLA